MTSQRFIKRSGFRAPVEALFDWHARPGALERLVPPWDPLTVTERQGGILPGATVTLRMKAGPIPFNWRARHTRYEENRLFQDVQVKGPFAAWTHTHRFIPDGPDASVLEDQVDFALPAGALGGLLGNAMVRGKLARIFDYRHRILGRDIALHQMLQTAKPMKILVSGASGVIGKALVPFLTTGGHQVIRLVRCDGACQSDEVFWDPQAGRLDPDKIRGIDAVIHLAGENIGQGRWTREKKARIIESRTQGTDLISRTIAGLDPRPKVFLCASAVGYYGHRGQALLSEADPKGDDFISGVCAAWEQAATPALESGIRTVFLRIGVVLTPVGGALQRLLPLFRAGLGGKLGSGDQYVSWIGIDDALGAIYHALDARNLEGPLNVVAPEPVTNAELTRTLARVLGRPAVCSVPQSAVLLAFPQMGREVVLSSTRVSAEKLVQSGYTFWHAGLEPALRHLLGKM